jgi:hypothetical protein
MSTVSIAPPETRSVRSSAPPPTAHPGTVLRVTTSLATVIDLADRRSRRIAVHPVRTLPARWPAPPDQLPDPTSVCCAIVRTAVEVLRGEKPVAQMARWVSPDILAAVHRRARLTVSAASGTDGTARAARITPVRIVRTRTVRIGERTAEATVIVRDGDRVRAAAIRVEAARGSWHAVALELG